MDLITVPEIQAAHELIKPIIRYTPMESSRPIELRVGGPVHLKCENLQRTGSFKIRGAYTRISRLSPRRSCPAWWPRLPVTTRRGSPWHLR